MTSETLSRRAHPVASGGADEAPAVQGRGWAVAGVLAGLAGMAGVAASLGVDAVYDPELAADPARVVDRLADQRGAILVFHVCTMAAAMLVPVFAAGLVRRLRQQAPAESLLPTVAGIGLVLVSVAALIGSGVTTELVFGVSEGAAVPEAMVMMGHWIGTIPWLWAGAGLAGVALAIAALRHGAAARWLGWVSLVLGGLTLLFGVSPLQYMAGFVGPVWLVVVSTGLLVGSRRG